MITGQDPMLPCCSCFKIYDNVLLHICLANGIEYFIVSIVVSSAKNARASGKTTGIHLDMTSVAQRHQGSACRDQCKKKKKQTTDFNLKDYFLTLPVLPLQNVKLAEQ